jgi:hypothetical protein
LSQFSISRIPDLVFSFVQIYPDESHGLEGVLGHLHHSMEDHLAICLGNVTLGTILEPQHHTDLTTKFGIKTSYTVKKVSGFLVPSWDVTDQTLPGQELLNYSRPGRVWYVTSQLGTGKPLTFFYSVCCPFKGTMSRDEYFLLKA